MSSIRIQSAEGTWSADQARVFRIGRDESSDIVAADPTVSRHHAEIRALGEGWEVVDLGSSLGTWVNGQRVQRADLRGTTAIGLGDQGRGMSLTVTVVGLPPAPPAPAAKPPMPMGQAPGLLAPTMIGTATGPAGAPGILLRRRVGADLRFPGGPGAPVVRIGRDPALEVHADDPAVSRLHAVLESRPDGWWWVDRSTTGSFVDGERVQHLRITDPVEISLGHPTAGYELEVVPVVSAGQAAASLAVQRKKQRSKGGAALAATGIGVGVLALLVGLGAVLFATGVLGGDDDPVPVAGGGEGLSDANLDRAKRAAVLLTAFDEYDTPMWSGSGSIISDDGLILTNAHVADPDAPGLGSAEADPAYLTVSLTSDDDSAPAQAQFRANPIVSDGYLDVAIVQINADVNGSDVDPATLDLPEPLPIGDSDALRTGDDIVALGYPAIGNIMAAGDRPLTITEGVVSTFQSDDIIGTDRGAIDSDVRLGSGNSGGPSINEDGEIIGLNTRVVTAASTGAGAITQGSALIVPVNLAADVLEIAESGGDPEYVSPYVDELPTDPGGDVQGEITSAGWVKEGDEGSCAGSSSLDEPMELTGTSTGDVISAEFVVAGVADDTPITIGLYGRDGERYDTVSDTWDLGTESTCVWVNYEIADGVDGVNAVFQLGTDGTVGAENPVNLS